MQNLFLNVVSEFKKFTPRFGWCASRANVSPPPWTHPPRGHTAFIISPLCSRGSFAQLLSPLHPLVQPEIIVRALAAEWGLVGFRNGCLIPPLGRIREVCGHTCHCRSICIITVIPKEKSGKGGDRVKRANLRSSKVQTHMHHKWAKFSSIKIICSNKPA